MPTSFTAFTASNRDPNSVYNTGEFTVPDNEDTRVRFTVTPTDFLVDEPDTTVIYWIIEIADGPGQEFRHKAGGSWRGLNGVTPPRPHGTMTTDMPVAGSVVRGTMYFETTSNRLRFGVSGETL